MSTKPDPDNRLSTLVRLDAIEAALWPPRIARALQTLNDHRPTPLRAANNEPSAPSSNPPLPELPDDHRASIDRKALIDAVLQRERLGRTITRIINTWAPTPTPDESDWCKNHLDLGMREPRSQDGSVNCDWCANVNRNFGKFPTRKLAKLHAQGRRIDDPTYRKHLGLPAA